MALKPLKIPPGVWRNGTQYQGKGRWKEAQLVRFLEGTKQPVGGWEFLLDSAGAEIKPLGTLAVVAFDDFTDTVDQELNLHTPDFGIAGWEYDGSWFTKAGGPASDPTRVQRQAGSGGQYVRSTADITVIDMTTQPFTVEADIIKGAVDDTLADGLVGFFQSSVDTVDSSTPYDGEGIWVGFDRTSASTADIIARRIDASGSIVETLVWANITLPPNKRFTCSVAADGVTLTMITSDNHTGASPVNHGTVVLGADIRGPNNQRIGISNATVGSGVSDIYKYELLVEAAGVTRALLGWSFGQQPTLAIGTNSNLFTFTGGTLTDRTPTIFTPGTIDSEIESGQYGFGDYGSGNYGEGDPAQSALTEAGSWQLDTFGDFLVGVHNIDGQLVVWDPITSLAVEPTAVTGTVPVSNVGVVVTPERFVVVLGAGGDDRLLQWADRETLDQWDPVPEGATAGDQPLPGQGKLMTGARGKDETLIWTDQDLFAMRFIGGDLVYSVPQIGTKCGIISRHAKAVIDGRAIWMGQRGFFEYDGFVRSVPSEVNDFVFGDFNRTQRAKVFAWPLPHFGEVWFFYCSSTSQEPDRYVIRNYLENHWSTGELERTAGIDRGAFEYPMMADVTNIYDHERGTTKDGAPTPFLESGPVEIGDGDRLMDVLEMVPDEATIAGQVLGSTEARFFVANHPDEVEVEFGPFTMANPTTLRLTARQIRIRIDEVIEGDWRVGEPRFDIQPGSRR